MLAAGIGLFPLGGGDLVLNHVVQGPACGSETVLTVCDLKVLMLLLELKLLLVVLLELFRAEKAETWVVVVVGSPE